MLRKSHATKKKILELKKTTLALMVGGSIGEPATLGCPSTSFTGCRLSRPMSLCTICEP